MTFRTETSHLEYTEQRYKSKGDYLAEVLYIEYYKYLHPMPLETDDQRLVYGILKCWTEWPGDSIKMANTAQIRVYKDIPKDWVDTPNKLRDAREEAEIRAYVGANIGTLYPVYCCMGVLEFERENLRTHPGCILEF